MRENAPTFTDARILVIDDEPSGVEFLVRALFQAGYRRAEGVSDPRLVRGLLSEFEPDLVLLDLLMPHVDGFEVLDLMTRVIPSSTHVPVLVLTADATTESKRRALAAGATDFLTKPLDLTEVLLRIRNMLELRQLNLRFRTHNRELEHRVRERTVELERALETERESAQQLRQLDQLKDGFLTAVSHELRTPLTSVLGSALTLEQLQPELTDAEQHELLAAITTNARKLNKLVEDLLDLDRLAMGIAEPKRLPTDIPELIHRVVADTEVSADHRLIEDYEEATIDIDAPKVERIVENLLVNAGRHTPPGTPIWVKAWRHDSGVILAVEDAGPGLPEDLRETVFEPFQHGAQAVAHSPGIGIGLALVARFAQIHGGDAWVEERDGGGASFRVFLPGGGNDEDASSEGNGSDVQVAASQAEATMETAAANRADAR